MEHMIFFIVDNMNRGYKLIDEPDQNYEVSQLNLEAGEKALSSSAFHSAAKYLLTGLSLLGPESWETKYKLTIRLYDAGKQYVNFSWPIMQYPFRAHYAYFIEF
jgi:predicted ATPase